MSSPAVSRPSVGLPGLPPPGPSALPALARLGSLFSARPHVRCLRIWSASAVLTQCLAIVAISSQRLLAWTFRVASAGPALS
eukprot:11353947-Alexandrium_andersonii.AAC.1